MDTGFSERPCIKEQSSRVLEEAPTPSPGLHCTHSTVQTARACTLSLPYSITQVHTKWKGQQESLALRNLTLRLPGTRTRIWKHPQEWTLLNTGNRPQGVEKSQSPTNEAEEVEDCRTQRTQKHERNPAGHSSFHGLTELERFTSVNTPRT